MSIKFQPIVIIVFWKDEFWKYMLWFIVLILSLYIFLEKLSLFAVIESDPCCFQVSIVCEPEKPEDQDCKGNKTVINGLNPGACFLKVRKLFWGYVR